MSTRALSVLLLSTVLSVGSLAGCGSANLRIGDQEYRPVPGWPPTDTAGLLKPLPYERFLDYVRDLSHPTETMAWHYEVGNSIATGGFSLSCERKVVEGIISQLVTRTRTVEFLDQKFPRLYKGYRKAMVLTLDPYFDYVVVETDKDHIVFETMRFGNFRKATHGMRAMNRDLYLMVAADKRHNRINLYYSEWIGWGPFGFPDESGYRENDGYVKEIRNAGIPDNSSQM